MSGSHCVEGAQAVAGLNDPVHFTVFCFQNRFTVFHRPAGIVINEIN